MGRVEHVEIEMHGKMRDSFRLDPIEHWLAVIGDIGGRRMPDTQFLQNWPFGVSPRIHAGDHHP